MAIYEELRETHFLVFVNEEIVNLGTIRNLRFEKRALDAQMVEGFAIDCSLNLTTAQM